MRACKEGTIGKNIRERRQQLNVTQQTLADLAEVSINTLVAIERGTGNPSLSTLIRILDTLSLEIKVQLKGGIS